VKKRKSTESKANTTKSDTAEMALISMHSTRSWMKVSGQRKIRLWMVHTFAH